MPGHIPRGRALLLACALAFFAFVLAACGGGDDGEEPPAPATAASPGDATPAASATPLVAGPPDRYCTFRTKVPPEYELELKARWRGKRITLEGSVDLPGPASLSWFVCQNLRLSLNFRFVGQPKLDNGKIRGASQLVENPQSPRPFDPNAAFEVVVVAQDPDLGLPYFIVGVPVEGKPE